MLDEQQYQELLGAHDLTLQQSPDSSHAHLGRGDALFGLGRYDDALAAYECAIQLSPDNSDAWRNKGQLYLERGYYNEAITALDEAIRLNPRDITAHLAIARPLKLRPNIPKVRKHFAQAIELDPHNPIPYIQEGSNFEFALYLCSQVDPTCQNVDFFIHKGHALCGLNRFDSAIDTYQQALIVEPYHPTAHVSIAHALLAAGRDQETNIAQASALHAYEHAIKYNPHNPARYFDKALFLSELEHHQEALVAYEQALVLDPAMALAWYEKANTLYTLHRYDEALAAYEQFFQLSSLKMHTPHRLYVPKLLREKNELLEIERQFPPDVTMLIRKAHLLIEMKRYTEAQAISRQAIKRDPAAPQAYLELGHALYRLKQNSEAVTALQHAITLDPGLRRTSLNGYGIESVLEYLAKIEDCNRMLQQDPGKLDIHVQKIKLLSQFGWHDESKAVRHQLLQPALAYPERFLALSGYKYELLPQDALIFFDRWLQQYPDDANAHSGRVKALYDLKRYDDALEACKKTKLIAPADFIANDYERKIRDSKEYVQRAIGKLTNPYMEYIQQGGKAWNSWRKEHPRAQYNLSHTNLNNLDLSKANLHAVNLQATNLSGTDLTEADLSNSNAENVNLTDCRLAGANIEHASLSGATLCSTDLTGTSFQHADLSHTKFRSAFQFQPPQTESGQLQSLPTTTNFSAASLYKASLEETILDHALLVRTNLREAKLRAALLRYANLCGADLTQATLFLTNLVGADLSGACLENANLQYADLRGANLHSANLRNANLTGALLKHADLSEADLSGAILPEGLLSLTPPTISTVELTPGYLTTLFRCQCPDCSRTMKVELVASGVSHPDDKHTVIRTIMQKSAVYIVYDYLIGNTSHTISDQLYQRAAIVLRQGDSTLLNALHRDFTPFYCRRCRGIYCERHMRFKAVWDDDGTIDYWTGTCPEGHPQFVDN